MIPTSSASLTATSNDVSVSVSSTDDDQAQTSILHQIVEKVSDLYSLPAVALEVVKLTGEAKVDCQKLKDCIENDPGLTCKILKFVNSPAYGLGRQVSDLKEALAIVGIKTLKLLVLSFSLPSSLLTNIDRDILAKYWRLSLTKAVAARELSRAYWKGTGDEAFVGGLMQHVGMLALIQQLGKTYTTFLARVWKEGEDIRRLEVASMGFDHTILSARLLDSWCLPPELVRAIGSDPHSNRVSQTADPANKLIHTLHLAELTTRLLASEVETALPELIQKGEAYTGKPLTKLDATLLKIETHVNELSKLLDIELSDATRYSEVLDRARQRVTELAYESANATPPPAAEVGKPLSEEVTSEVSRLASATASLYGTQETSDPATGKAMGASDWDAKNLGTGARPTAEEELTAEVAGILDSPVQEARYPLYDSHGNGAHEAVDQEISGVEDPALNGCLVQSIARCRQQRWTLGLALIEIDGFEEGLSHLSPDQLLQISSSVTQAVRKMFEPDDQFVKVSDSKLAIVFENTRPEDSESRLRELLEGMQRWAQLRSQRRQSVVTISIGLASMGVPSRNFEPDVLIERSERCLSAAQHFGGDTMKTIVF